MTNQIYLSLSLIKKISLFGNLSGKELQEILQKAQIHQFKKGEILFSREDKALHINLVLEGVVKLFISNEEGEETVLQIADFDKTLNDIFSSKFQANAQALEICKILTIPRLQAKEFAAKNLNFALNILNETAEKNIQLTTQLAQQKLTNAKQKVGQFLLGMAFEKTGEKAKNITLKCDKSVVASYLGIKPETLSRTLQKLKDDGEISVEKNQITLLQEHSLCHYCDSKIAEKCSRKTAHFCEQNQF
ncbi:MAG: Crp/Fnr family transcriptional regulator [Rickettsiales bacterium]|nr:Crp/Fnr family transcriptional regulator [Rickettsiales bacterium]